jgi:hypothetical protein
LQITYPDYKKEVHLSLGQYTMVFQAQLLSRHVQLRIEMGAMKTETFMFSQAGSYQIT